MQCKGATPNEPCDHLFHNTTGKCTFHCWCQLCREASDGATILAYLEHKHGAAYIEDLVEAADRSHATYQTSQQRRETKKEAHQ